MSEAVVGEALAARIRLLRPEAQVLHVRADAVPSLLGRHFDYIVTEGEVSDNLMGVLKSRLRSKKDSLILSSLQEFELKEADKPFIAEYQHTPWKEKVDG